MCGVLLLGIWAVWLLAGIYHRAAQSPSCPDSQNQIGDTGHLDEWPVWAGPPDLKTRSVISYLDGA